MKLRRFLGPTLVAAAVAMCGLLPAQTGPKKESGDTVSRPRKKASDDTAAEKPPETQSEKIPSKLQKKPGEKAEAGQPTFRSDTLTVSVDVAVLDNRGRFIPGIPAGNFRVLEDGVPQKVSGFTTGESPITLAMVIEFSNLYQQYWSYGWQETLTACYGFLQTLKPEDTVAVVAFDMRSEILSDFSTNRQDTYEAMARLRIPAFSESNLYDALTSVADRMSDIEGRKAILYIGSGMDTFSKITFDVTRRRLQTASVPIYALGTLQAMREYLDSHGYMGPIQRLDFLQADNQLRTFSKETGGQSWFPRFFGEYGGIFRQISEALRNTYSLSYQPTNTARDGKYRKIKVDLVDPRTDAPLKVTDEKGKPMKYTVVAKTGYQAPREVE
ncbi:VWA domain-containing protein [Paludibaculum fermentans]|uniref:VWA domain-containing protein n=1 Tax=Paludibaculum fermentans TaxID=1473598 RepID=A0A7S7NSM0_PALFE|nr:VWA domain-containing protein [Paludibaculum fermentans]QOY89075.1 VWA domain-containing protein [Paludibaculum fermentans]